VVKTILSLIKENIEARKIMKETFYRRSENLSPHFNLSLLEKKELIKNSKLSTDSVLLLSITIYPTPLTSMTTFTVGPRPIFFVLPISKEFRESDWSQISLECKDK